MLHENSISLIFQQGRHNCHDYQKDVCGLCQYIYNISKYHFLKASFKRLLVFRYLKIDIIQTILCFFVISCLSHFGSKCRLHYLVIAVDYDEQFEFVKRFRRIFTFSSQSPNGLVAVSRLSI